MTQSPDQSANSLKYRYHVALSYASEDRDYVHDVAKAMKQRDIRVFLDSDAQAEMWGEDLVEFLDNVYRRDARFAVLFLSRHYAEKMWTREERRSALARAMTERSPYVLPIRLDDTEVPGVKPTVHYLDARRVGIGGIVDAVAEKLRQPTARYALQRSPRTPEELEEVLARQPAGWEYLAFAGFLRIGLDSTRDKFGDHELGFSEGHRDRVTRDTAIEYMLASLDEVKRIVQNFVSLFDTEAQERAFGPPGKAGDPARIRHLAQRLTQTYEQLLDWSARIRSVARPSELDTAFTLLAELASEPIRQFRAFVDSLEELADAIPEAVSAGRPLNASLTLEISLDTELTTRLTDEMNRVYLASE